ncbi:hypothetical protein A33Y_071 [Candidatus Carsonella ruddii CS isolate Thao2000]|uniref:Uncharacterized protein n=1 Tax=Candidatus Carsonella ruddii CS isolate Thao2000 TaxID=1202537 RepID=J7GYQ3_CARRU|nr:hypothetical protein [Candidatus Carsonella ruddii]AFP83728.1 hypothetical protein A33Y_071 [Candidatus Carsonella ruddii CS isolate Thao2000]
MNIQNLIKFKKKFGQNFLIFFFESKINFCLGLFLNYKIINDIDYHNNFNLYNKNFFKIKKIYYSNILLFKINFKKKININLSFNISFFFLKKIFKIKIKFLKIIIQKEFFLYIKNKFIIIYKKNIKNKFFFPFPKIKIIKFFLKKKKYIIFYLKKINLKLFNIKIEKNEIFTIFTNFLLKKNVLFNKI